VRALIIGCGYVGLPLGAELARAGHEVFGLRRSAAAAGELRAAGIKPITGNITVPESLPPLTPPFDWVINCVGSSSPDPGEYRRVYLEGTRNLIDWLAGGRPQKFVYTSSTGVYGQDDGSTVDETSPAAPVAETAGILVETENLLLAAASHEGFPAVILRVAGIYGPARGYWLKQVREGKAAIEGAGDRILNMIHRDDVVGCIVAALKYGSPGEVYNASDDQPTAQRELLEWLSARLGMPLPQSAPRGPDSAGKRGATSKKVSNRKLKMALAYQFKYPTFREGYEAELRNSPA
jgi:nucleoside-diphosphate-sugar epimerase